MSKQRLDSVAKVIRGVTFSKAEGTTVPSNDRLPVIRAGSIQRSLLLDEGQIWVPASKIKPQQTIKKNDIVMCTSSGSSDLVGKCAKSDQNWNGSFGAFCAGIRAEQDKCDSSYLYHFLCSPNFRNWTKSSSGANIKNIRASELAAFEIPLPPLKEQKCIAAILDKADAIRRKRQQAIDLTDQLLRSVFLDMFGDGDVIKMKLEDALERFIDYRGKTPPKVERGIPLVTAKIIKNDRIETPKEFIAESFYDEWMSRGIPEVGDLLFTTEAPLGKSALVDNAKIALAQRVLLMRGRPGLLDNAFLMHAIRSQAVWDDVLRRSSGSTVKGIRQKELRQVMIPVPDFSLQKKFAAIVHEHEESRKKFILNQDIINTLFEALTQQAFSGELTKQTKAA